MAILNPSEAKTGRIKEKGKRLNESMLAEAAHLKKFFYKPYLEIPTYISLVIIESNCQF